MALRVRKSFTIAKGVRVNLGKTGASLSFGKRGLRQTIHTSGRRTSSVGLPGTGVSYVTTSSGGSRGGSTSAARQFAKEQQLRENVEAVEAYEELIESLKGIHREGDEYVDWQQLHSLPEPFNPQGVGPKQAAALAEREAYRPNLLERTIRSLGDKKRAELEQAVSEAAREDAADYEAWRGLHVLSRRVLDGDTDAYLEVINEMNPLAELLEFGSEFEFGADNADALEAEFRFRTDGVIPQHSLSLTKTGRVSEKALSKTAYYALVQTYVCSCTLRIARDMFALLPVRAVTVHTVDHSLNSATGHQEEITVLSVVFERAQLESLYFELVDPADAMTNFRHNMRFLKTAGFKPVDRIE